MEKQKRPRKLRFQNVLDAYLWHGKIGASEYKVGVKFNTEYSRSVLRIKVYDQGAGNHGDYEMSSLSVINGNALLRRAFNALSLKQREVLIAVCVENYRAGGVGRVELLRQALQILEKEWRY